MLNGFALRGWAYSNLKSGVHICKYTHTHTHTQTRTHTQLKRIQEVCPNFLKSLRFSFKVVPWVRMSHWPHNGPQWQPVLRGAVIAGECHSGRVLDALYSLHAKVLTPCVSPLTPHLLSPLMWLYWLWHTEHGDDDQTIKSSPKGRAIRVTNHSTGFVCPCMCVCTRICACSKVWQYTSNSGQVRRVKFLSPHHPPSPHEYETALSFLIGTKATRDTGHCKKQSLILVKLSGDQEDQMVPMLIEVTERSKPSGFTALYPEITFATHSIANV